MRVRNSSRIYLNTEDLGAPIIATIVQVQSEDFISQSNGRHTKTVVAFIECAPLVLNRVNRGAIAKAYGDDSNRWIGKTIELYYDPSVRYAGSKTGGIRVRIPPACATTEIKPGYGLLNDHPQRKYDPARRAPAFTVRAPRAWSDLRVWAVANQLVPDDDQAERRVQKILEEAGWRDFSGEFIESAREVIKSHAASPRLFPLN